MGTINILRELWSVILDTLETGDPVGHLRAWWQVVTGRVTPDDPAGEPTWVWDAEPHISGRRA